MGHNDGKLQSQVESFDWRAAERAKNPRMQLFRNRSRHPKSRLDRIKADAQRPLDMVHVGRVIPTLGKP